MNTKAPLLKGNRTFVVALLPVIFGFLATYDWGSFLNNWKTGLVGLGSGLLMVVMRLVTNTPPGQSTPDQGS